MKLPSLEECSQIFEKYEVPSHIRAHTQAVREIANYLAQKISSRGNKVDLGCVDRAALLHDSLKMYCIKNNCDHAHKAHDVLAKMGYGGLAEIIMVHGLEEVLKFDSSTPLEAKIVWYADKRVNHDKVVSLQERYDYLKERYGKMSDGKMAEIVSTEKTSYALEKELLRLAGLKENFLRSEGWKSG